ncbi:hypothetical protein [Enterococcus faecium]|uniref:hypothetical protein n=1 Tax=Enterococcus faecium TaxID=1352 RepID=UPI003566D170
MKNRFSLALWSALFIGMFSCSSAVHGQTEGATSLKIVPLNEQFPRMLYIDDLLFVSRYTDEHNQIHRESNDLSITFLDSRKESTEWQLQLKTEDFRCKKDGHLLTADYQLGRGMFSGKNEEAVKGLEAFEYDHQDAGKEYRTIIQSTGNKERGIVTYTIPGEQSTLTFPEGTSSGHHYSKHYWRFVNAEF